MRQIFIAAIALFTAACATSGGVVAPPAPPQTAWIVNTEGASVGQARFTETPSGVLIRIELNEAALPVGWHGAHLHRVGDCSDAAEGFKASGSHVSLDDDIAHGLFNPRGFEAGDLPNIYAPASSAFGAEFFATKVSLTGADKTRANLLDQDGSALVIHAAPDDHVTQPIGGAGPRLACAALTNMP